MPTPSGEDEAQALYEAYSVATPAAPLFQSATANLNPWTETKVDTKNPLAFVKRFV